MALEIQNDVKAKLVDIYNTIKDNPTEFTDSNIHIHVGSVLNKFFGGINNDPVGEKIKRSTGKYQQFKPSAEDFKKKSVSLPPVAPEDQFKEMTLAELKVEAKRIGIKYSNKTRDELIRDIAWHSEGERDMAKSISTVNDEEE